ncbi:hypothetical protein [uncultured Clostridium sp.]|uniref:hypothetical protein n=1 Tax=uncultured Clostridium sp. TaxID=59620 RepID=UPI0025E24E6B|nr:hypothetical protein [uncultured Clostridium sp.]
MKLLRISYFNIRKKKGASISLLVLIMLASLFLNIGLNISGSLSKFYFNKVEELHAPHYIALFENSKYNPEYLRYIEDDPRVAECETEEIISMHETKWSNENSNQLFRI